MWFSIYIWHWESALYCKRLEICRKCCGCMVQEMKLFITWKWTNIVHVLLHVCSVCFVDHVEVLPLSDFEAKYVTSFDTDLSSNKGWLCDFIAVHLWLLRWLQYFKICVQVGCLLRCCIITQNFRSVQGPMCINRITFFIINKFYKFSHGPHVSIAV